MMIKRIISALGAFIVIAGAVVVAPVWAFPSERNAENRCNEKGSLLLGDESTKVILTPDGTAEDVSDELAEFLNYLAGKGGSSLFVKRLNEAVEQARNKEVWRME